MRVLQATQRACQGEFDSEIYVNMLEVLQTILNEIDLHNKVKKHTYWGTNMNTNEKWSKGRMFASEKLRVKVKSLAEESRIIRHRMSKVKDVDLKADLQMHRRGIVRSEARHSQLAAACVRGRPYCEVENKVRNDNLPNFAKMKQMVERMGFRNPEHVNAWIKEARTHLAKKSSIA